MALPFLDGYYPTQTTASSNIRRVIYAVRSGVVLHDVAGMTEDLRNQTGGRHARNSRQTRPTCSFVAHG